MSTDSRSSVVTRRDFRDDSDERRIDADLPFVSIVIPVYNDPQGIQATLDRLISQSYSMERYEIVVVDNGSTDHTRMVVQEYCELFDVVRLVVEDDVRGHYAARNRGIGETSGPVVAFVEANTLVGHRWIELVAREMATSSIEYLACDVELSTPDDEGVVAKYNRLADRYVQRFVEEQSFTPTCGLVVRRTLFEHVGTFDPRLRSAGDFEFGNRVCEDDRRLEYFPNLTMSRPACTSIGASLGKAKRVGRGKAQLRRYYPDRYGSPLESVLNPRTFLPPRPDILRRTIRTWSTLTRSEKIAFFVLTYITSLAKVYGQLVEIAESTDDGATSS